MFITISFSLLADKQQSIYEKLFEELNNNILNYSDTNTFYPKYYHLDFERAISNAIKIIFPNITIKFCNWHFKRNSEIHKNEICKTDVESNDNIYILKCITNMAFIDPDYIIDIYNKIFNEVDNNNFKEFLKYFKKTYLLSYEIEEWNYFDNIENITNNACESYNNYINSYFNKKPTFYKLLYFLREDENKFMNNYLRVTNGIWKKKKNFFGRTDEIFMLIFIRKRLKN